MLGSTLLGQREDHVAHRGVVRPRRSGFSQLRLDMDFMRQSQQAEMQPRTTVENAAANEINIEKPQPGTKANSRCQSLQAAAADNRIACQQIIEVQTLLSEPH